MADEVAIYEALHLILELKMDNEETIKLLKNGNTNLLEALMEMVNQYFIHNTVDDDIINHGCLSAEENSIEILQQAGMAERVVTPTPGYKLLWDKLEERKKVT